MKIAVVAKVRNDYFNGCTSMEEALRKVCLDENVVFNLTCNTISRLNDEEDFDFENHAPIRNDDEHITVTLIWDNFDPDSHETNAANDVDFADELLADFSSSFRFSNATTEHVSHAIGSANTPEQDQDEEGDAPQTSISEDQPRPMTSSSNDGINIPSSVLSENTRPVQTEADHPSAAHNQRPTRTITYDELMARFNNLHVPGNTPIYLKYYEEGQLVEYGMPTVEVVTQNRTNIDNANEVFTGPRVVIY